MDQALIRLSPRLRTVAERVPAGATVADVGTDHARLLVWLRAHGRIERGIGIDVVEGPLRGARRNVTTAGVEGVELRQGDGLEPLRPGEADVVVLAGMGGALMLRLLDARPGVVAGLRRLLLQPNTDWARVRRWVMDRGRLLGEQLVEDRGKFYVVLEVEPGVVESPRWSEDDLVLGPRLRAEHPPVFEAWLRHERARVERALARATPRRDDDDQIRSLRRHQRRLSSALEALDRAEG